MAHLGKSRCTFYLETAVDLCGLMGIPLAENKIEGPVQCIKYLGIIIDVTRMEIRFPEDKLQKLLHLLHEWEGKTTCKKKSYCH